MPMACGTRIGVCGEVMGCKNYHLSIPNDEGYCEHCDDPEPPRKVGGWDPMKKKVYHPPTGPELTPEEARRLGDEGQKCGEAMKERLAIMEAAFGPNWEKEMERKQNLSYMQCELDEWHTGKRHVFWRVKWREGRRWVSGSEWTTLKLARSVAGYIRSTGCSVKVFRVTVRPKR